MSTCKIIKHSGILEKENIKNLLKDIKLNIKHLEKVGKGSYGLVLSGIYKKTKIALKIQEVANSDNLNEIKKEIYYQNKANSIKRSDGKTISIPIYKCIFLCKNNISNKCNGLHLILMPLGREDLYYIFNNKKIKISDKNIILNKMLENLELLVKKSNIYLVDIKPENAIILKNIKDPKIIDFGYKYIITDFMKILDFKKMSQILNRSINKNDINLIFITLIQIQFSFITIDLLKASHSNIKPIFITKNKLFKCFEQLYKNKWLFTGLYLILTNKVIYKKKNNKLEEDYKKYIKKIFYSYVNRDFESSCDFDYNCEYGFILLINKLKQYEKYIGKIDHLETWIREINTIPSNISNKSSKSSNLYKSILISKKNKQKKFKTRKTKKLTSTNSLTSNNLLPYTKSKFNSPLKHKRFI